MLFIQYNHLRVSDLCLDFWYIYLHLLPSTFDNLFTTNADNHNMIQDMHLILNAYLFIYFFYYNSARCPIVQIMQLNWKKAFNIVTPKLIFVANLLSSTVLPSRTIFHCMSKIQKSQLFQTLLQRSFDFRIWTIGLILNSKAWDSNRLSIAYVSALFHNGFIVCLFVAYFFSTLPQCFSSVLFWFFPSLVYYEWFYFIMHFMDK